MTTSKHLGLCPTSAASARCPSCACRPRVGGPSPGDRGPSGPIQNGPVCHVATLGLRRASVQRTACALGPRPRSRGSGTGVAPGYGLAGCGAGVRRGRGRGPRCRRPVGVGVPPVGVGGRPCPSACRWASAVGTDRRCTRCRSALNDAGDRVGARTRSPVEPGGRAHRRRSWRCCRLLRQVRPTLTCAAGSGVGRAVPRAA